MDVAKNRGHKGIIDLGIGKRMPPFQKLGTNDVDGDIAPNFNLR